MRKVAWVLGLAFWTAAGAQVGGCGGAAGLPPGAPTGVFRGTVAGQAVVLDLDLDDPRYAYESRGADISLEVTHSGAALILQESQYDDKALDWRARACFRLTPAPGGWRGTWARVGGAPQPVALGRVGAAPAPALPASPGLLKLRRDDVYDYLKLNRPWEPMRNGAAVREPRSGLAYPRLPGESAALNGALQDRQLQYARGALACAAGRDGVAGDTWYELQQDARFLAPRLLSFVDHLNSFCGGAHPNAWQQGAILDRLTGEAVPLTDIWPLLDGAAQHRAYLNGMRGVNPECREVLGGRDSPSYTASLTPGGVQLIPDDLPHVVQACADPVTVPYARLRDLSDPSGPYFHDFYPR